MWTAAILFRRNGDVHDGRIRRIKVLPRDYFCIFCISILKFFGGKMTSEDWQQNKKNKSKLIILIFGKAQLVKELLSFDFWISRHLVTIFRNIRTFQDILSPKAIELFQRCFHICFYTSRSFKIICLFCHNLKFNQFCCESCVVIFPPSSIQSWISAQFCFLIPSPEP